MRSKSKTIASNPGEALARTIFDVARISLLGIGLPRATCQVVDEVFNPMLRPTPPEALAQYHLGLNTGRFLQPHGIELADIVL